ncbi:MauE/DoxX family redox-associated membrane protein [Janibacter anophelis]|uniref:MauE/DoxX family redox-associated membrane protein n=1 Tax=Janibacter anophelis TaxID=319054 RepID=UPI003F7E995A
MSPRVRDHVGLLARLVLGVVLVVAGALKIGNPLGAARAVQAYEVMPFEVARWVGYALPWIEIVVGVLLVLGLFTRTSALLGTVLMLAFVIGIAQAWARGLTIDCGCFGGGGQVDADQTRYGSEILRDLGLALCGAWLVARSSSTLSLDRALFGADKERP